ncbi:MULTISPECIES: ISAs1 family transposase [Spirulina sp. CCY15215]|uniref:ISAs1 family transposase n=1 Tax=Spirulina sp. CCY15215 TaxID=2767591 RepID=UPI00195108E6|nr:ISAs1 family transposase [Spirulina major]
MAIEEKIRGSFQKNFAHVQDPRNEQRTSHLLIDIIAIALLAVISGAEGWGAIETYGKAKEEWLKKFLDLPNGIPSHDTFSRVFARLSPQEFEQGFQNWLENIVEQIDINIIAIDGKMLRQSYDRNQQQKSLILVSAWCQEHRLVLGQEKVDSKSNEITAIPQLLNQLDIAGCTITIDAMGTQKEIASQICQKGGDYILALKANQKNLYKAVYESFEKAKEVNSIDLENRHFTQVEKSHNRIEKRTIEVLPASVISSKESSKWQNLATIIRVERERKLWNKTSHEICFYISSLEVDAQEFATKIRSHWGIENTLHWTLDVTFSEDKSRIRRDHAAENFAILRRLAVNLINQEKTLKSSTKMKRYRAALDNNYLLKILSTSS